MNNQKIYTEARAKLAALEGQEKSVIAKQYAIRGEQQAAKERFKEATERAAAARGKVMRGTTLDEEFAEADIQSEKLLAEAVLNDLRGDDEICRNELGKLRFELIEARTAVSAALQKICDDVTEQLGESLTKDKKLRSQVVDIFVAYSASADRSLGSALGGVVDWSGVLEGIFPMPTDAEYEAAYSRFKSSLQK